MQDNDFYSLLTATDPGCFFQAADPKDCRLGAVVTNSLDAYQNSRIAIISCGQDQGVRRNMGRPGAAEAPAKIREALYRLAAPSGLERGMLIDLGDTRCDKPLEEIHNRHFHVIRQLLKDGKRVIVLGGGNDLSYPDVKAVQAVYGGSVIVNVDAHLDIRQNPVRNSGTPYRQLLDEKIITGNRFFEIGIQKQANSRIYLDDAEKMGLTLITLSELLTDSPAITLQQAIGEFKQQPLFLGFDMDAVKAADAPGVSAPSPTGLSAELAFQVVKLLCSLCDIKLLEITEVNPVYDRDNQTTKLAAILIHCVLESLLTNEQMRPD